MMQTLQHVGFESIHGYDEDHCRFDAPWSYLVCFKGESLREQWYRTEAQIDIELHKRLLPSKSGDPILRFFDAATMIRYQTPPKSDELAYCRKEKTPWECTDGKLSKAQKRPVYSPFFDRHRQQDPALLDTKRSEDILLATSRGLVRSGCNMQEMNYVW